MRRRDLITLFGSTAIAWPLAARAQQPANIPTVGWLVFESASGALDGFRQGLRELGYVEGQNIAIESRSPEGSDDRLVEQIEELARLKVKSSSREASRPPLPPSGLRCRSRWFLTWPIRWAPGLSPALPIPAGP